MKRVPNEPPGDDLLVRNVHLEAREGVGGWRIRLWLTYQGIEGLRDESRFLSAHVPVPDTNLELDQMWLVMLSAMQLLEEHGVGSVSLDRRSNRTHDG